MELDNLKSRSKYLFGKTKYYYALSVELGEENEINGVLIREEGEDFTIVENLEKKKLNELNCRKFRKYPILLNIAGSGINTKVIKKEKGYLKKIIFNANFDNFYLYEIDHNSEKIISFSRKETVDNFLASAETEKWPIIHLTLGPCCLTSLLPLIQNHSVYTEKHLIEKTNSGLRYSQETREISQEIMVDNYPIVSSQILPFSCYVSFKTGEASLEKLQDFLAENLSEFKFGKILSIIFPLAAVVLLVLTITGHFFKAHLAEDLAQKDGKIAAFRTEKTLLDNLKKEVSVKKEIYNESGFKKDFFFSKNIADLTNSVPESVRILKISLQPIVNQTQPDKMIKIDTDEMVVHGKSYNDTNFNEWILQLPYSESIDKVEVIDYSKENDGKLFTLLIKIIE